MKRRLRQILKKNEKLHNNIFNQLECEMEILRTKLQKKYDKKVEHLRNKFGDKLDEDTKYPVPPHLKDFEKIKIYSGQLEKKEVKVDVDVIGNVQLTEDELEVLRLPPNFAVLAGKLSEEDFVHETEMSMTKVRWETPMQTSVSLAQLYTQL